MTANRLRVVLEDVDADGVTVDEAGDLVLEDDRLEGTLTATFSFDD